MYVQPHELGQGVVDGSPCMMDGEPVSEPPANRHHRPRKYKKALWRAYGVLPKPNECVMHLCDNGWCDNPQHLRIATYSQNTLDATIKRGGSLGGDRPHAKLTKADVFEMRRLRLEGMSYQRIADQFNVVVSCAYNAINEITWKGIGNAIEQ